MRVKIYVEGGGNRRKALRINCRQGFAEFLKKAGIKDPSIIPCGGRQRAYERFCKERGVDGFHILLVDSEAPVTARSAWEHVAQRSSDRWERPEGASDDQIHLMVQAMEAWFYADQDALQKYYGRDFRKGALSQRSNVEAIPKADLFSGLQHATRSCLKGEYSKGDHAFQILALIDPAKVKAVSTHAERFLIMLDRVCKSPGRES